MVSAWGSAAKMATVVGACLRWVLFEPELVVGSGLLVMVATRMMLGSAPVLLSAAAAMVVFGGVMGGDGGVGVLLPELYAVMVAPVSASSKLMVLRKTTRMM